MMGKISKLSGTVIVMVIVMVMSAQSALAFHFPLIPCSATGLDGKEKCELIHLVTFVRNLITVLLEIATPLAVIFIVYGGFVIMTAGGSEEKVIRGRQVILSAVVGLIIAAGSWLIVTGIDNALKGLLGK